MRPALVASASAALVLAGAALAQEVQPAPPAPPQTPSADAPAAAPGDLAPPPEEAAAPPPERATRAEPESPEELDTPAPPPPPLPRPRYAAAVLQATDKITAETLRFEAKVNQPVRYKGVVITVHACETTAADEAVADSIAHMEVSSQPEGRPGKPALAPRQVFRGWMFAGAPALHPFEHPVYDLWVIACRTPAPEVAAGKA